jgi:hypothetical protein
MVFQLLKGIVAGARECPTEYLGQKSKNIKMCVLTAKK